MTPQTAIQILDEVASQVSATREVHLKIQSALSVLTSVVNEQEASHNLADNKSETPPTPAETQGQEQKAENTSPEASATA